MVLFMLVCSIGSRVKALVDAAVAVRKSSTSRKEDREGHDSKLQRGGRCRRICLSLSCLSAAR
jgi:hypothetical protein